MKRYFIFKDEKSQKFWNIDREELNFTVVYGRLGTAGQTQVKTFDTAEKCTKEAEKLIKEKIKKGYTESTEGGVSGAKDEAKRFGYDWDTWKEKSNKDLFKEILEYKKLPDLKYLTIANWCGAFESGGCQDAIDFLVENKEKFAHIESLRIGDMESEETELSWIEQGNYSKLWGALPNLKHLTIQGSNSLKLSDISHEKLESLTIISGGLPLSVLKSIEKGKLPNLEKLNLYFGVEDYGCDINVPDVETFLQESNFPKLKYLGLCNSEIVTGITKAVLNCKYRGTLETLDLSKSTFTDESAQLILDDYEKLENLKLLDLEYHFVGDGMMKKLKKLPFIVNLKDRNTFEDEWDLYPMFTE